MGIVLSIFKFYLCTNIIIVMKKKSILLSLVALCVSALFSCSDKNDAPSFSSQALQNAELVNVLKAKGFTFNEKGQLELNDLAQNTQTLDLSGTKLKDLTGLDVFPNLHELKLANNGYGPVFDFDSIPAKVIAVDLTGNEIYDFHHLVKVDVAENGEETVTPQHSINKLLLPATARFNSRDLVPFYRHNQNDIASGKVEMKMVDEHGKVQPYNTLRTIPDVAVLKYIKETFPSIMASDGQHVDLSKHLSLADKSKTFYLIVGATIAQQPTSVEGMQYIVSNPSWEGIDCRIILKEKLPLPYFYVSSKLQKLFLQNVKTSIINTQDAHDLYEMAVRKVDGLRDIDLSVSTLFGQRDKDKEMSDMVGSFVEIIDCPDVENLKLPNKTDLHALHLGVLVAPKLRALDFSNFIGISTIELGRLNPACKLTYPTTLKHWYDYGGYVPDADLNTTFVITEDVFNRQETKSFIKKFYLDRTPQRLSDYDAFLYGDLFKPEIRGIFWTHEKYISQIKK